MESLKKFLRYAWVALAVLDVLLLGYVASAFDWAGWEVPQVGPTPAGSLVQYVVDAVFFGTKALAAAFVIIIAYSIYRDVRGDWYPRRLPAIFASVVLGAVLVIVGLEAFRSLSPVLGGDASAYADRLLVYDRLAYGHAKGEASSIAGYVLLLCAAAYLAEKYLLRWWGIFWPLSVVAIALLAWPVREVLEGERQQRNWVVGQEWAVVAEKHTWPEALAACSAKGAGWRLPRRNELPLYLSTRPEATKQWRGTAWTLTTVENARAGVVVDLTPRKSGTWHANAAPARDRSPCETNGTPDLNTELPASDLFTRLRHRLCAQTDRAPGLYTPGLQLLAEARGRVVGGPEEKIVTAPTQAATICIRPAQAPATPPLRTRRYKDEMEFASAEQFGAKMKALCVPRAPGSDPVACAAFAPPP